MHIIEIAALENGAHRNQTYHGSIPPDWGETAFIREDVSAFENFPFGEVEAAEIDGVMTMTKWTPGIMPEQPENVAVTAEDLIKILLGEEVGTDG